MKKLLFLGAFLAVAFCSTEAQVHNLGSTADFDQLKGDATATVTDDACGINFLDNSTADKPEALYAFPAITTGFQIDFDVTIDNTGLVPISDPDILIRMGNPGVDPTSNAKTGFGLIFRHRTDDTNQLRATNLGNQTTAVSGFSDLPDGWTAQITIIGNNDLLGGPKIDCNGGTIAVNTYDLYVDGVFVETYSLGDGIAGAEFDPALGFGSLNILGGSNSDSGVSACIANFTLSGNEDTPFCPPMAIPTVGQWGLILLTLSLSSIGLIGLRESKEEEIFAC